MTNSAVLPQQISPLPRYYCELGPHRRGVTVNSVPITAEKPRLPRENRDPHPRAVQLSNTQPRSSPALSRYLRGFYRYSSIIGICELSF